MQNVMWWWNYQFLAPGETHTHTSQNLYILATRDVMPLQDDPQQSNQQKLVQNRCTDEAFKFTSRLIDNLKYAASFDSDSRLIFRTWEEIWRCAEIVSKNRWTECRSSTWDVAWYNWRRHLTVLLSQLLHSVQINAGWCIKLEYLAVYGRASMAAFRQLSTHGQQSDPESLYEPM